MEDETIVNTDKEETDIIVTAIDIFTTLVATGVDITQVIWDLETTTIEPHQVGIFRKEIVLVPVIFSAVLRRTRRRSTLRPRMKEL